MILLLFGEVVFLGFECCFLLGNEWFVVLWVSPLERGLKGCVTVRSAGWMRCFAAV